MTGFLAVAVGAAGGAAAVEEEDAPLGSEGEADEVEGPARCDSLRSEKDVWW